MEFLPIIEKEQFKGHLDKDWDFIYKILDPYQNAIDEVDDENVILDQLCDDQHTLLIYDALYGQVTNGGFLQLIHNGYGAFVFDPVFIEDLERWTLMATARLLKEANVIYLKHKDYLEEERDLREFSTLCKSFKEFEPFDDLFYEMMEDEVRRFRTYIENHITDFVKIV
ncbi:DMP19 family protein [Sphingobacterium spiritivorum]|uniref:DMP19 family protein n=1 Tax=Sphingobacterium TaxID=28453 RepID=UPI0025D3FC09|nr:MULTISPECIES: DMP19 family protein [unclassified Sphingobacterium]